MKLRWSQAATADMDRIWHFLADHAVDRADRTEAAINAGVEKLIVLPYVGRPRSDGGREMLLPKIQYRVSYIVKEDDILITAVRSTRESS